MKKFAILTLAIFALFSAAGFFSAPVYAGASSLPAPPAVDAEAAILIEHRTGKILFQKNADKQMYPASTTKILTALLAIEKGRLDDIITVGIEAMMVPVGSSIAGLSVGDQISLGDLVYGLMLPSGNDAAYSIAVYLGRRHLADPDLSAPEALRVFAELMNQRAQELGAVSSNFSVPDGFHANDHYTTAHDLALIAQAAMNQEFFRLVVGTGRHVPESWIGPNSRPWGNTNQLVRTNDKFFYPQATGLKTGYTRQASFCLAASGSNEELDLIAVVLNTSREGRWTDSTKLLEFGFANFRWVQLVSEGDSFGTVEVSGQDINQPKSVSLAATQGFGTVISLAELENIEKTVLLDPGSNTGTGAIESYAGRYFSAPLERGEGLGELIFSLHGEELFRTTLVSTEDIAAMPWWRKATTPGILVLGLGVPSVLAVNSRRKKQRRRYIFRSRRIGK